MIDTEREIKAACNEIAEMLIQKNRSYGDSALNPMRVFSKAHPLEQLNVRMDDKLSRLLRGDLSIHQEEDVEKDLVGYLILKMVCKKRIEVATAVRTSQEQQIENDEGQGQMEEEPKKPVAEVGEGALARIKMRIDQFEGRK